MSDTSIDVIITYVDNTDEKWQKQVVNVLKSLSFILSKRYRFYNLLETLFKLIRHHMPFVKNIFLICAIPSLIPTYFGKYNVTPILHKDIIPKLFLPTFQSNSIEMFIHKVKDLSEMFIYFNDDMFPISTCVAEDFFRHGKPLAKMRHFSNTSKLFDNFCKNAWQLAYKTVYGKYDESGFKAPKHYPNPMLKSYCEEFYKLNKNLIYKSISKVRMPFNYNQYMFTDYIYLKDMCCNVIDMKFKYFTVNELYVKNQDFLKDLYDVNTVCINDTIDDSIFKDNPFEKVSDYLKLMLEKTMI